MTATVQRFGDRVFVLGLDWPKKLTVQDRDTAVETYAAQHSVEPSDVRFVVSEDAEGKVRIFGMVNPDDATPPAKAMALSALCARRAPGIYAVYFQDESLGSMVWLCLTSDGVVISEMIVPRDEAKQQVAAMSLVKDKDVYATTGCGLQGAQTLSIEALITSLTAEDIAAAQLRRLVGEASRKATKIILAVSVVVLGLAGFIFYKHYKSAQAVRQAEQARQAALASYIQSAPGVIGPLAKSPGWVPHAVALANRVLPPYLDGFTLAVVQCTPMQCAAAYFVNGKTPFSYRGLARYFRSLGPIAPGSPRPSVSFVTSNSSFGAKVAFALPGVRLVPVTPAFLQDPPSPRHTVYDWIGAEIHAAIPGEVKGSPTIIDMATLHGGNAAGEPPMYVSRIAIDGRTDFGPARASVIAYSGSIYGFVPDMAEWSPGVFKGSSFRVEFTQVSRSDP